MKANLIKGALAALIAASAAYFRALLGPVLVLALVMASDYVTGVLAAYRSGALSSRTGLLGILKKLGYLFCVGVAVTVDFTVRSAGARLGCDLGGLLRLRAAGDGLADPQRVPVDPGEPDGDRRPGAGLPPRRGGEIEGQRGGDGERKRIVGRGLAPGRPGESDP